MSARHRRSTAAVTTAGAAALLTLCGTAATASAQTVTVPRGLTISDGTRHVIVNGKSIDFGTIVRDLAWNPSGSKAAFIDGRGDLVVSDPDGSHRVTVAANPGGQTWS